MRRWWSAIVIPPRVSVATNSWTGEPSLVACVDSSGYEDLGTRIERVQETVGSPPAIRRELPGFGWDPYGQD